MYRYWSNIFITAASLYKGMVLTMQHLRAAHKRSKPIFVSDPSYFNQHNGLVTLDYPYETLPVPDHGRYQLHNEMDDCIVCDKCAVICPVQCIAIETIKSPVPIGETSDGTVKRLYAERFDIDMAKCCFCGLCTSVCPTECLTMTNEYDFSVPDITKLNVAFANLSPAEAAEKKELYTQFVAEKEALKKEAPAPSVSAPKPAFKPQIPVPKPATVSPENQPKPAKPPAPKPVFGKPVIKPVTPPNDAVFGITNTPVAETPKPVIPKPAGIKPIIKPVIKKPDQTDQT